VDRLLTAKETASLLRCHLQTIYKNKALPCRKIPGVGKRYKLSDIEKYADQHLINPILFSYSESDTLSKLTRLFRADIVTPGGEGEMPRKGKSKTRINFGFGAIYERKTKKGKIRWYLDYRNAKGEREQKLAPHAVTQEDAARALREEVLRAFNSRYGIEDKKSIAFKDFSRLYLQDYIMVKRRNWQSDKFRLDALGEYFKDNQDLQEITPMAIQGLIKSRQKIGNSGSTINRFLALMKHMFNKAIEEGYLESNPVRKIKLFPEKENRIERVLTKDEEAQLMAHSSGYLRTILIIALNTGMRLGEILNLKWDQVDFEAGKITVEKSKSGKPRAVFINTPLLAELQSIKSLDKKSPYLFFNEQTQKPLTRVAKSFTMACKKAEIRNLRIHDLRHTFASRLIEKGADIETVRSLLGHCSVAITQRYTHSQDEAKKRAVELLSENPSESPIKGENLLHGRYTASDSPKHELVPMFKNRSYLWN